LLQREVAVRLGVNASTYLLWEQDRSRPVIRRYPCILAFLGYDPFPSATALPDRIAAQRRRLGLSVRAAAAKIGVDEGTFRRWESVE